MKRILPLILALVAGMAQADSNSDYRAGSDFAHQIKGQGSSSIQGFKPQESIPGYNANPDETKYYGGVTAGGDGGLKNDGTTEWATGETGKTITESFMNKPKDILSPDAPFIQTGRDVVNRADSIVGNTGQQCSAQEISRSEYTNYTCERDLQVEQYCTRTARMELQGSTTWETRTLEYEMSQLSGMFCCLPLRMRLQKPGLQRLLLIIVDSVRVKGNEVVWFRQCRPKILFQLSIGQKSRYVLIISV